VDGRAEESAVMERYTRNVLVVEPDPVERERLAAALETDGFEVLLCTGPGAPDYSCIGAREGRCPLATDGCIVILDLDLDSDAAVVGTSAEELLGFYLGANHRVVTLSTRSTDYQDERALELRHHPEQEVLLNAVWAMASPDPSRHSIHEGTWS